MVRIIYQLNKSFGSGEGFTHAFTDSELTRFIQVIKARAIQIAKGTTVVGKQPASSVWVMIADTHISATDTIIPAQQSPYIWTPTCILAPNITPVLSLSLCDLIEKLEKACKCNFLSALLTVGGMLMACHYTQIVESYGGFSLVLAVGQTETGKSIAIKAVGGDGERRVVRQGIGIIFPGKECNLLFAVWN